MKKLMIAFAAAVSAVALNASQFSWGFTEGMDFEDHTGAYIYDAGGGTTAMLFLGTVSYDQATGWSIPTGDAGGQLDKGYAMLGGGDGSIGPVNAGPTSPSDARVSATGGDFYTLVVLEKAGVTDLASYEGYYYLETGKSKGSSYMGGEDGQTPIKVGTFLSSTVVTQGMWLEATAVPEPTSGLLLLLGVAGLALRRRRA